MYSLLNLEQDIEEIIQELSEVRAQKGHDYSGEEDTFANLRAFGWQGVIVRLGDKFHRLMNFMKSGGDLRVQDEKIEDTMQDFVNYALFMLILYRQDKEKQIANIQEAYLSEVPRAATTSSKEGFASKAHPQVRSLGEIEQDFQTAMIEYQEDREKQAATGGVHFERPPQCVKKSKGMIVSYEDMEKP